MFVLLINGYDSQKYCRGSCDYNHDPTFLLIIAVQGDSMKPNSIMGVGSHMNYSVSPTKLVLKIFLAQSNEERAKGM